MKLPIDVIPNTRPVRFRWKTRMDSLIGVVDQDMEGSLPATVEKAVADLITLCKRQQQEIVSLKKETEELYAQLLEAQKRIKDEAEAEALTFKSTPSTPPQGKRNR